MELTRGTIELVDPDTLRRQERIEVQFNPSQLTLSRRANYESIGSARAGLPLEQYTKSDLEEMTLDLFFDTTANRDMANNPKNVCDLTKPFEQLTLPQPNTQAPPVVRLTWGEGGLSFQGIATSISRTYTLFAPNLVPVRAQITATLREYITRKQRENKANSQSSEQTKTYQVKQSDTLPLIAAQEYGSSDAWTWIAAANKIVNPRRLRAGDILVLPRLDAWRAAGR